MNAAVSDVVAKFTAYNGPVAGVIDANVTGLSLSSFGTFCNDGGQPCADFEGFGIGRSV